MEIDIRNVLPAIRVPTLVVHKTDDRAVPVEAGRYLAEHIPDAKLVERPGVDHFPFVGDYEGLVDEVEEFLTGSRRSREPDRVLATVLFTDIVGSTERAAELGDRSWTELLDEHHRLVRGELERCRGKEVRISGDGFLATFDGPARAIRCALGIRDGVRELGLEIRAGLHTGEIELADTGIEGIAVHIGARIASLAGAGEVLASSTVKDLVVGSGIDFADHGTHDLKGVPGEWRVYSATG
jgi:class 3 adenylate cyclase